MAEFTAELRNKEQNPRQVRAEGKLPATIYGKGVDSMSVMLNSKEFLSEYAKDKKATFKLNVNKKAYNVQVQDVQVNYATGERMNVQFKLV